VDAPNDIAEFLASRRAKVTPEQVGLPSYGPRRVPGLRRDWERVAKDLVAHLRSEAGAEPGSRSEEGLDLLASWAATSEHETTADAR
jgi:hypothetical protein